MSRIEIRPAKSRQIWKKKKKEKFDIEYTDGIHITRLKRVTCDNNIE